MGQDKSGSGLFEKVRGVECLYRYRPTGAYYARFQANGKEVRKSLRTSDRQTAKRELAKIQGDQSRIDPSLRKLTLAGLADIYLKTIAGRAKSTMAQKTRICERIKKRWPGGSQISIAKVVPSQIEAFLAIYSFRPSNYNTHLGVLRAMFELAVGDRLLPDSPCDRLKSRRRTKPVRLTPTYEQFEQIVADIGAQVYNADSEDSADFVELLGRAGLGQAEAAALKRSDVDLDRGLLHTFRCKTRRAFDVPIFPSLRPLLDRLLSRPGTRDEKLLRIQDAKKSLAGACKRLGFPRFSQRSLRRMFVTRCIEKGVDIKVLSQWQGHVDQGVLILQNYSHVNRAHSDRMAQLI